MGRVLSGIDAISNWSGKVVSIFPLFLIVILLIEITSRYVFNSPTIWAHETSQHIFGAYGILTGAYVLLYGQHVKVEVIWMRFSIRGRAILDLITSLFFFLFVVILLIGGMKLGIHSVSIMAHSQTYWGPPLWPLRLTIPLAAILLLLQGFAQIIRTLSIALAGRELA